MKPFSLKQDKFQIIFDTSKNIINITGRATPIDPFSEYRAFLTWFDDYIIDPPTHTQILITIDFFNSIFTKFLVKFFLSIENSGFINNFDITWVSDDRELSELAEDLKNIVNIRFEIVKES